jgi:hypothetical protein
MKKQNEGLFFDKMARPDKGRFFRDMAGRDDGLFLDKTAYSSYAPGQIPSGSGINASPRMGTGTGPTESDKPATEKVSLGETGGPVGGMGERGEGMSGGMYGAGNGKTKTAATTPNDWDADSGLPTGFHRPASEQPEALEEGGERFFSTEASNPAFGGGKGVRHGLLETGGMNMPAGHGHQVGKHASAAPVRFLGTSFGTSKTAAPIANYGDKAEGYASARGSEAAESLRAAGRSVADTADKAIKAGTRSPAAMGLAALLLGRVGLRGMKRLGRGAARAASGGRIAQRPPGLAQQVLGGAKKLISG